MTVLRRRIRGVALFVGVSLVVLATGAWVVPNGSATAISGATAAMPDPAAVATPYGAQIYGTNVPNLDMPEEQWSLGASSATGSGFSALSNWRPGTDSAWAPSVQQVGAQYIMWYAAKQSATNQECLESAYSTDPHGYFSFDTQICAPNGYNWIDPSMYYNPYNNDYWLVFSQQTGNPAITAGDAILSTELNSNATSLLTGSTYTLMTFAAVANAWSNVGGGALGANPEIENPVYFHDPQTSGSFDMLASWGSYKTASSYYTIEFSCGSSITSMCTINSAELDQAAALVGSKSSSIDNAGGASLNEQGDGAEQYELFAAPLKGTTGSRQLYFDGTNTGQLLPGQTLQMGQCLCNPDGYELRMQTDGNLVLYTPANVAVWQSHTALGIGPSYKLVMQSTDGNLVIYENQTTAIWQAHTYTHPGAFLELQDSDNNIVVYGPNYTSALWAASANGFPSGGVSSAGYGGEPANTQVALGVVSGGVTAVESGLAGSFVTEDSGDSAVALASDPTNGISVGVLNGGTLYVKTGLYGSWVAEDSGVASFSIASDPTTGVSLAVLTTGGTALVKTGLYGSWVTEDGGDSAVALASDSTNGVSLGVLYNGTLYVKTGLYGAWVAEDSGVGSFSIASDPTNGVSVAALIAGGTVLVKTGLYGTWVNEDSGASEIGLASDFTNGVSLGVLNGGTLYAKTGLYGAWVAEDSGIASFSLASDSVDGVSLAVLVTDGSILAKSGLSSSWVVEDGSGSQVELAN